MEDEVLALAKSLGQIGEKEAQVLGTLCGEASRTLDRRLRGGVRPEDCADAYRLAAAWLALAALEESRGGVRRFSAGDLTIEKDSGGGKTLESRAWALMRPYVRDDDFVFRGVRG